MISYIDSLVGNTRKGRHIRTYSASATTHVARAGQQMQSFAEEVGSGDRREEIIIDKCTSPRTAEK